MKVILKNDIFRATTDKSNKVNNTVSKEYSSVNREKINNWIHELRISKQNTIHRK